MNQDDKALLFARCLEMAVELKKHYPKTKPVIVLAEMYYKACFSIPYKIDRS